MRSGGKNSTDDILERMRSRFPETVFTLVKSENLNLQTIDSVKVDFNPVINQAVKERLQLLSRCQYLYALYQINSSR